HHVLESAIANDLCTLQHFEYGDGAQNGRVLDDGHHIVAQRRYDPWNGLWDDDLEEGVHGRQTQSSCCFLLTIGYGLGAGSIDLRTVGAVLQRQTNGAGNERWN